MVHWVLLPASEVTYGFINEVYTWGAWDFMWPEFLPEQGQTYPVEGVYPAFANAAGKYYLQYAPWPINIQNKKVAYHTLHYFGDAFSTIYTEVPLELSVSHAPWILEGVTTFEVSANEGSLIGLSVNGELIGKAYGTGNPVSIDIPPQYPPDEILVTVTKQNYYRYEAFVPVGTETGWSENLTKDKINIYPNPAKGDIFIEFPENSTTVSLILFNVLNEEVYHETLITESGKPVKIDLSKWIDGIYFLHIQADEKNYLKKIIVHN